MRLTIAGGPGSFSNITRYQGYEGLVRWTPDWKQKPIPNVAESFKIHDAGKTYTFKLRKGMKWSDGEPFDADDVMFWYEDVMSNKDLTPAVPAFMLIEDKVGRVERLDRYTVQFKFPKPHGLFLQLLAQPGAAPVRYAKHYFKQFHKKYNRKVDELAEKEGFKDWIELFAAKGGTDDTSTFYTVKDLPLLDPWTFTKPPRGGNSEGSAERNPYYWKVDPKGRQLPYIDTLHYTFFSGMSIDQIVLKILQGELDMEDYYANTPENKPVLARGRSKGQYQFFTTTTTDSNDVVVMLNLNHKDHVKREVFLNKNFRIGLSYAINRKEVIKLVFGGAGIPYQPAPRPGSEYYNHQLAKQYVEYDKELSNHHLDEAGYTVRDGEGFRQGPDGKRITINFTIDNARPVFLQVVPLLKDYWKSVGIDARLTTVERSLFSQRVRETADFDATLGLYGGGDGIALILDPRYYFPMDSSSFQALAWTAWYNGATEAATGVEEPPASVRRQMQLYDKIKQTPDPHAWKPFMKEILQIAADDFHCFGIRLMADGYGIKKNTLRNVPKKIPHSWTYPDPAPTNPEQYFFQA